MRRRSRLPAASLPLCAAALLSVATSLPAAAAAKPAPAQEKVTVLQRLDSNRPVDFEIYIPLQHRDQLEQLLTDLNTEGSPRYQKWLTPQQFHQRFGVGAADLAAVQQDLARSGLATSMAQPHHLHVTGAAGTIERVFGTELHSGLLRGKEHATATRALSLPSSLQRLHGVAVGLSGKVHLHHNSLRISPNNRYTNVGPYWFTDLKQAYKWPSYKTYTGKGASIAVLVDGNFQSSDMDLYFGHEGLAAPNFQRVLVDGGAPFDPDSGGSGEASLDLQQSGGTAPNSTITLYSIPNLSDKSVLDGLSAIVEDNKADVVNMSFGGPEAGYLPEYNDGEDETAIPRMMDDLMAQGNAQGITFVASSGDSGGLAVPPLACFLPGATPSCGAYQPGVEFPASSPHVTGVGGTNLKTTSAPPSLDSAYVSESAFFDPLTADIFYGTPATGAVWGSGGGNSVLFRKPLYQLLVNTGNNRYRTVPDVAGHEGGCPGGAVQPCNPDDSADILVIGGGAFGAIGTSASAPDFAGLLALTVERFGTRLGNANNYIYALSAAQKFGLVRGVYNWKIPGDNGAFTSGNAGYNRVLGNGTVNGAAFLLAPRLPLAGTPQTPSNP